MAVMTTRETCESLKISRTTLWRLRKSGELEGFKVGSRVLFTDREVEEFIRRKKNEKSN